MKLIKEVIETLNCDSFVRKIYIFGSRSLGTNKINSDYDFCIVVDDDKYKTIVIKQLGNIMVKNKVIIHPYVFSIKEFNKKIKLDIYKKNIIENGQLLYKR